jgi:hypothetical protein
MSKNLASGNEGSHEMLQIIRKPLPQFIDPVFVKTSPKHSFSITENDHFGLDFAKTGSINSGTVLEFLNNLWGPGIK